MGKDQELLQAVKTEDLMTVQKLLQRPKPGKASRSAFYLLHHICDIINSVSHNSSTEMSLSYMPVCVERVRIKITPGAQGGEPRPSRRSSEHQALSRHSSPFPPLPVLQCGSSTLLLS
ncbi:hypothetical protein QQF64_025003 [Cirrhinus molitorella]|uniref:Uncharacterized protein n=1 Tax=Cirrhinus molitorella TaxID=172907 RepID=A0ABR3NN47_9TELE